MTFHNIISDCHINPLLVTMMEADDENLMRNYLSSPKERFRLAEGKVWAVTSFEDIWHFFSDRIFICIHLKYDDKELITKPKLSKLGKTEVIKALYESNIQIGILCRKSTSGKMAFLNAFFDDISESDTESKPNSDKKLQKVVEEPKNVKVNNDRINGNKKEIIKEKRKRKSKVKTLIQDKNYTKNGIIE